MFTGLSMPGRYAYNTTINGTGMICPKCGADNPEDTLFCEECDWRMDIPYKGPKNRNVGLLSSLALIIGAVSVILAYFTAVGGAAAGAVGLLIGGYSINAVRLVSPDNRNLLMALSGAGLLLSVVGFIFAFANL